MYDKKAQSIRNRAYYKNNQERLKKRHKDRRQNLRARNRKYVAEYLAKNPCVDCGEDDPIILEFDHVRGKKLTHVTKLARDNASLKRLDEEIAKCEVRCANCHRIKTHETLWAK